MLIVERHDAGDRALPVSYLGAHDGGQSRDIHAACSALSYTFLCISPDRRQANIPDTLLSVLLNRHGEFSCWMEEVPVPNTDQIREALMFSQFRFKLIEFLKLPSDIREPAFRGVLERTSGGVCRNYLARAERVQKIIKSENAVKMSAAGPPQASNHF